MMYKQQELELITAFNGIPDISHRALIIGIVRTCASKYVPKRASLSVVVSSNPSIGQGNLLKIFDDGHQCVAPVRVRVPVR